MTQDIKNQALIHRDGSSQQDRNNAALHPDYVQLDGRKIEDLIAEAQRLAKELRFIDAKNEAGSNWEALFLDDAEEYQQKSETGKAIQRANWARQLAAYLENPERFHGDPELWARLSRPHVTLFTTFLKLLEMIREQLNGLTKKHLDFYFLERLGFTPKDAVPDVVHVLLELANGVEQLEVKQGTVLSAGNDDEGNELLYTTEQDTVISKAEIVQLRTVSVEKRTLAIRDAHLNHRRDRDRGFTKMLEMALGHPEPGDPLPAFPEGIRNLQRLKTRLEQQDVAAQEYVQNHLCFSPKDDFADFRFIMETHEQDLASDRKVEDETWESVYTILDQAYKNKVRKNRRASLAGIREADADQGLQTLLKHVYGSPEPGNEMPLYRGGTAEISRIYTDLIGSAADADAADLPAQETARQEASEYIREELLLTEKDFLRIVQIDQNSSPSPSDWEEIYQILELAERKVRNLTLPSPDRHELFNVFSESDAKGTAFSLYGEEEESMRFRTFGGHRPGGEQPLHPADLGFAISSPILLLEEGIRTITATLGIPSDESAGEGLRSLFDEAEKEIPPFVVHLSGEEAWIRPSDVQFSFGDFIVGTPESLLTATLDGDEVNISSGAEMDETDLQDYIVWTDGTVFEIIHIADTESVKVQVAGTVDVPTSIGKYQREDILLHAIQVSISLGEEELPIVPHTAGTSTQFIASEFPALAFSLNHRLLEEEGKQHYRSQYQKLMDLRLKQVHLQVNVEGMRAMNLLNEQAIIDPRKAFAPFGDTPEIGNRFYFTNPEIAQKRLDDLSLEMEWRKVPENFGEHYANYWKIEGDDAQLPETAWKIRESDDFKAKVFLCDHRAELELGTVELFPADGAIDIEEIPQKISNVAPGFHYQRRPDIEEDENVLEWDRYFKLELDHRDFQHSVYNGLFRKQSLSDQPAVRKLHIHEPYTPRVKVMKLGYAAHTRMILEEADATDHNQFYHIHPFGYRQVAGKDEPCLLPTYQDEGELYLGINQLITPQSLSILFQMSEGSADPEVEKPNLQWSYLRENEWVHLPASAITSDTTNGLMNTGILQIQIPADAGNQNTLMPEQLHWLKISCNQNMDGISDLIEIKSQAVSAIFSSDQVADSHFETPLPAESITETREFNPGIRSITQPYTSSKGKPVEQDSNFYNRISERLRHKNRAVSMWDYERMVLDQFPEVYKVKCLPATDAQHNSAPGMVNVLVIPDIQGKIPFNPFEPKVPSDTLFRIRQFLDARTPAFAEVAVRNPTYLQIKIRCVVKFLPGYNEGFYKAKLNDELKRFLAPWAYGENGQITIGGSIYASVMINFIAERPYIDYVANMKLFQSEDGKRFIDVRSLNDGENKVTVSHPDTVLVSAQSHEIDVVDERGYDEDNFEGINYMKVELDFKVGEDMLPT